MLLSQSGEENVQDLAPVQESHLLKLDVLNYFSAPLLHVMLLKYLNGVFFYC